MVWGSWTLGYSTEILQVPFCLVHLYILAVWHHTWLLRAINRCLLMNKLIMNESMISFFLLFGMELSLFVNQGKFPGGNESRTEFLFGDSLIEIQFICHTICSFLKYAIQWFLVYSQICVTITMLNFRTFSCPQKGTCTFYISSSFLLSPTPQP